jgi:hypothetical protein
MKEKQDYIRDITEMRTLMERSSKFMSLSGLACLMVGVYALSAAWIAYRHFGFNPDKIEYSPDRFLPVVFLALTVLILAIITTIFLSYKNATRRGERSWNSTVRRLMVNMAVPLITGGILMLIFISKGYIGLIAPFSLLFYGLALFNSSKFSYPELRSMGLIQIALALFSIYFIGYGLLIWALGFGIVHIIYGTYLHYRYER